MLTYNGTWEIRLQCKRMLLTYAQQMHSLQNREVLMRFFFGRMYACECVQHVLVRASAVAYVSIRQRMLTHADVCVLTYADVC